MVQNGNGLTNDQILTIAIKKASQSTCNYRVSAIGLNKKGEVIGTACNKHRFLKYGGSIHAEMSLMARYGKNLKTIIICRVGAKGDLLPIEACCSCASKAKDLGIKIVSIGE